MATSQWHQLPMIWTSTFHPLIDDSGIHVVIRGNAEPLTYADVIHYWQHDDGFRTFFINLLAAAPFDAFRWETPPVTRAIAHQPFEYVLLDSPDLIREPDVHTFAEHFRLASPGGIVEFPNLGGDAWLVVPCPDAEPRVYSQIGDFIRHAPESQKHELWKAVGAAMNHRLGETPIWLSTAGAGVSWLHVRLDRYPKYYHHLSYRNALYRNALGD